MSSVAATSLGVYACATISPALECTAPHLTPPRRFLGFRSPVTSALACVPTAGCDGPSRFPRPQRFYPQALPWLPAPLHPSIDKTDSQQSHDVDTSLRCFRSSALPGESATFL